MRRAINELENMEVSWMNTQEHGAKAALNVPERAAGLQRG
jgi:hypothetical protein